MGETVTIIRRVLGNADEYGNPSTTTTEFELNGCLIAWGSTNEPVSAEMNPVDTQMTIYMPAGTVIEPEDVFLIRGEQFVKDGQPQGWVSMLNVAKGVVLPLRRRHG